MVGQITFRRFCCHRFWFVFSAGDSQSPAELSYFGIHNLMRVKNRNNYGKMRQKLIMQLMPAASHVYRNASPKNHSTPAGVVQSLQNDCFYKHINPPGWKNAAQSTKRFRTAKRIEKSDCLQTESFSFFKEQFPEYKRCNYKYLNQTQNQGRSPIIFVANGFSTKKKGA